MAKLQHRLLRLTMTTQIDPCTLVLFGATGNLARVKLYPGLFRLDLLGHLPPEMKILGVGRRDISLDEWRDGIKKMLDTKFKDGYDQAVFERFIKRNYCQQVNNFRSFDCRFCEHILKNATNH